MERVATEPSHAEIYSASLKPENFASPRERASNLDGVSAAVWFGLAMGAALILFLL